MLTRKGSLQRFVLYWYQHRQLSFDTEIDYRVELFKRNTLGGRTDGTVVRIATSIGDQEDIEQAQNRLKSFVSELYPQLVQHVAY
jgi:EpsI family protein